MHFNIIVTILVIKSQYIITCKHERSFVGMNMVRLQETAQVSHCIVEKYHHMYVADLDTERKVDIERSNLVSKRPFTKSHVA